MLGQPHAIEAAESYSSPIKGEGWIKQRYVWVSNGDDDHYWMGLENWTEVNAMIEKLRAAATEAFGPNET